MIILTLLSMLGVLSLALGAPNVVVVGGSSGMGKAAALEVEKLCLLVDRNPSYRKQKMN